MVNHGSKSVSVINTQTNQTIVPAIKVGEEPNGIAITPERHPRVRRERGL